MNDKNKSKDVLIRELEELRLRYNSMGNLFQNYVSGQGQVEQEFLLSPSLVDSIIEQSSHAIWISDDKGTLIRLNQACRDLLNIKNEEVVGKYNVLQDNIVEEQGYLPLVKSVYEEGKAQKFVLIYNSAQLKHLHLEKTASVILEVSIFPVKDASGRVTNAVIQHNDITVRKLSEDALQKSEQKYRDIFTYAPVGIYLSTRDGKFIKANNMLAEMLGYSSPEELMQRNLTTEIYWDKNEREALISKYAPLESVHSIEVKWKKKDGTPIWINLSSHVVKDESKNFLFFEGFIKDISEYKRVEQALTESEVRFRSLYENSTIGLYRTTPEGKILLANPALVKMLGYSNFEDLSARDLKEEGYTSSSERKLFMNKIEKEGDIIGFEAAWTRKDSTIIHIRESAHAIRDSKGKSLYYDGTVEDITARKLAEENLVKLNKALDNSSEAVFLTDIEGIITFINPGFTKIYGYTGEEIIGRVTPRILKSGIMQPQVYEILWETLLKGQELKGEFINKTKDGKLLDIEGSVNPVFNEKGIITGFLGIQHDISERKRAEKELQKSRQELLDFFEDDVTANYISTPDGKLVQCNKTFLKLFGFTSKEESFEYPIEKLYTNPNARRIFIDLIRKWKKIEHLESEYISLDGKIIYTLVNARGEFDEAGELVQLRGYILDITKRKKAEEGLRKLSRVVEQAPASVVITNPQGDIEYVNEKFCRVTGYTREEVIGKNPRILNSGHHPLQLYKDLWDTILSGSNWKGDLLNRKKNGDLYWESALISPLVTNGGEITHFVGIKEDITDKKKLFDELVKAKEKAEESDRLKSAFLANMSHEIRTPMNGILGFASLLKNPKLSGETMSEYINIMEISGARMLNIINDLIDISKIESGQMKVVLSEFNINEQAEYVYSFFKPEVERKGLLLLLKKGLPVNDAVINTDREKINAILVNLVKNAIKFTDRGTIVFGYKKSEDYLEFFVKDTGIGVEKNKLKAIFERFVQADLEAAKAYDGAGLGLSISKAYVEMLGGRIWVESEIGKGTQFYFTIPLQLSPNGKEFIQETAYQSDKVIQIKNIKMLIAEDEESAAKYLSIIFHDICKEILHVKTGNDAIEACRNNPDLDLVLMDIKMPGNTDGHEAVRQIREFNDKVVIIAQTAYAHASDRERALKAGCNDYISKPIVKDKLIELISKYVNIKN
jgi:PAS domain S-box-containing protein